MDEKQINFFIVVAEEENLAKASARLPISISALSRQIAALENEIGSLLFERKAGGLTLTPAGLRFLGEAKKIALQFEIARDSAKCIKKKKIKVGGFGSVSMIYIPIIVREFSRKYPDIDIFVDSSPAELLHQRLENQEISMYFDRSMHPVHGHNTELAFEDEIAMVLPKQHDLATRGFVEIEDLRNLELIGKDNVKTYPPEFLNEIYARGITINSTKTACDMVTAATLAASGMGVALVAKSISSLNIPNAVFKPFFVGNKKLSADIFCIYKKNEMTEETSNLLEIVRAIRAGQAS